MGRIDTSEMILKAATKVFALRGFHAATVREICAAAHANIALISRYFGSKQNLYAEVCRSLFEGSGAPLAHLDERVDSAESWRNAIREWIRRAIAITSATNSPGREIAGIFRQEMTSPSSMYAYLKKEYMKPIFDCLKRLLEMSIGTDDQPRVLQWASAIWAQTSVYALLDEVWQKPFRPPEIPRNQWLELVAEQIADSVFLSLSYHSRRS